MMKQVKRLIALVILLGVTGVIGTTSLVFADEDYGKKCNCVYPNAGVYGRKIGDDCFADDCWIEIP